MVMFIGFALGELASSAPTSGGLYFWTYKYASPKWRNFFSWIVGCAFHSILINSLANQFTIRSGKDANTIGNIAAVASIDWGCAVQVMAAITIASDDTFSPNSAQLL